MAVNRHIINWTYIMKFYTIFIAVLLFSFFSWADDAQTYYERALQLRANNVLNEAEIAVKNSIKLNPSYLPARILLGEILLGKGQATSAEKELETALSLNADTNTIILPLAKTKSLLKKHQEVLVLLDQRQALATNPGYYLIKANAFKALEDNEKAIEHYKLSIDVHGKNADVLTNYADLLFKQHQSMAAELLLNEALEVTPNYSPALLLIAEISKQQGRYEQALNYYQAVLQQEENNETALLGNAYLLADMDKPEAALDLVTKLREIAPNNPYAKLLHAAIISSQGSDRQAQGILRDIQQQILSLDPNQQSESEVLLMSAGLAYVEQNYHQAKRLFSRYIDKYGENITARKQLAAISLQLNETELASYHIDFALRSKTAKADIYVLAAHIYQQLKSPQDYLYFIESAYKKFTASPELKKRYALALTANNQSESALELYKNVNTDSIQNRTFLGYLLLQENKLEQALVITQSLLNDFPNKVEIQQLAGELSIQLGNIDDAAKHFEYALKLAPKFRPAQLAIAGLKLNENDLPGAIAIYQQILKQDPNDSLTRQLYADAAIKLDNEALAIELLTPIVESQPGYQEAQRVLLALYLNNNRVPEALTTLKRLEAYFAMDQELLLAKANIQLRNNEIARAQKTLKVLYGIVYDNPVKLGTIANLQINAADFAAANQTLKRIEQLGSSSKYLSARLAVTSGDIESAESIMLDVTQDDPAWLELIIHLRAQQSKAGEAANLSKQLFKKTNAREHLQLTTQLMVSNNDLNSAIDMLKSWVENTPNDSWARAQLSNLADKAGNLSLAISALEASPALHQQPLFLNNLANMYRLTDIEKAEKYAREANELAPNIAAINDTLGWILAQKQQYQEALSYLREAIARDNNNATYHYHITFVLLKLNRNAEAISSFEQAKKIAPNHKLFSEMNKLLKGK